VLGGTIDAIKVTLRRLNPAAQWLDALQAAEVAGKNRKGVLAEIDSARDEKTLHERQTAERNQLLSTTPEFCRVVALGWALGEEPVQTLVVGERGISEVALLEQLWSLIGLGGTLVGFNCLAFDLPVVMVRSALLGVEPTRLLDLKPWGKDVVDLYAARFGTRGAPGGGRPGRLKDLARVYGIEVPAGEVDGSQVVELLERPEELARYVASDIEVTRSVHRLYEGFFCL
jgi:hypothetical protein